MTVNTSWFDGLKWAEGLYHKFQPSVAEHTIRRHTFGRTEPFDQGARDYISHYEGRLVEYPEPLAEVAA